jgi:hypothetical protein
MRAVELLLADPPRRCERLARKLLALGFEVREGSVVEPTTYPFLADGDTVLGEATLVPSPHLRRWVLTPPVTND